MCGLRIGRCLTMFVSLCLVLAMSPAAAVGQPEVEGKWDPPFDWPNVGIHLHVLPNGKVLFWPRRELGETLDSHFCVPRVWDPETGLFTRTPQPTAKTGERFNLFCAGHTFLPDGRLLVAGGHFADSIGVEHATIYDPFANTWTPIDDMDVGNNQGGRWYPTVVTLPNGNVLVSSGSDQQKNVNPIQQIGENGHWRNIVGFNGLPLYPPHACRT